MGQPERRRAAPISRCGRRRSRPRGSTAARRRRSELDHAQLSSGEPRVARELGGVGGEGGFAVGVDVDFVEDGLWTLAHGVGGPALPDLLAARVEADHPQKCDAPWEAGREGVARAVAQRYGELAGCERAGELDRLGDKGRVVLVPGAMWPGECMARVIIAAAGQPGRPGDALHMAGRTAGVVRAGRGELGARGADGDPGGRSQLVVARQAKRRAVAHMGGRRAGGVDIAGVGRDVVGAQQRGSAGVLQGRAPLAVGCGVNCGDVVAAGARYAGARGVRLVVVRAARRMTERARGGDGLALALHANPAHAGVDRVECVVGPRVHGLLPLIDHGLVAVPATLGVVDIHRFGGGNGRWLLGCRRLAGLAALHGGRQQCQREQTEASAHGPSVARR